MNNSPPGLKPQCFCGLCGTAEAVPFQAGSCAQFEEEKRRKLFVELRERLLRAGVAPRHVRRYLGELTDHFADLRGEEERAGKAAPEAEMAAVERLGSVDELAQAMIARKELKSWSAKAPLAVFAFGSVACLAAVYAAACVILWTGWRIFLPGNESPFVPVDGVAVFYFGVGRMLYWCGPVLVGWVVALLAARQRSGTLWPAAGLVLVALMGATAHVTTSGAAPGLVGHVHLSLRWGATWEELVPRLVSAGLIFLVAALPYLIWRLRRTLVTAD